MTPQEENVQRQKDAALRILEKRFIGIGQRLQLGLEAQQALFEEYAEWATLYRLGGFGEPPPFRPSVQLVMVG